MLLCSILQTSGLGRQLKDQQTSSSQKKKNGSRRQLSGKGGKKDSEVCNTFLLDGEENPLICGFPVLIKEICGESEGEGIIPGDTELTGWLYFTTKGFEAVNLDTHKSYKGTPSAFSVKQVTSASAPGQIVDFTAIGTDWLVDDLPTTGAESEGIPSGPFFIAFDGYWEGTINTETLEYSNNVVDASIIDLCAELA
mmetsp:Transcript_33847/g.70350  ORF Transcript_33847/g.70350 Transcript_33847/m.70350 type:complete len:196 (-) Transcript_33847:1075-1662(-)